MADFARQCSGGRRALERVRRAFEAVCRRRIVDGHTAAVAAHHALDAQPTVASMAGKQILRKVVDACPHCGGALLFVEGVAHRVLAEPAEEAPDLPGAIRWLTLAWLNDASFGERVR